MNSSQTVDKSMVLPPAPSITDRLRCALPADSAHYGPTVVAHYYSTDSDYRPTLRITDRLCALPTDSAHYRSTLRITDRLCALPTDSAFYRLLRKK